MKPQQQNACDSLSTLIELMYMNIVHKLFYDAY